MKKSIVLLGLAVIFLSCEKKATEEATPAAEAVTLPFEVSYKGSVAVGDRKNVKTVMECNKRLSELNTNIGEFLADSVSLYFADGTAIIAPRDSAVSAISGFIGSLSSMKIDYVAAIAIDNPDLKHEWVFSWTEETYTYKDGKVEKQSLHEDYRLEGGKIREIFQYAQKPPVEPAK